MTRVIFPTWVNWLIGGIIIAGAIVASVYTAGAAGALVGTLLGQGLLGAVASGAIAGAVGGAISGVGISVGMQTINNGLEFVDMGVAIESGAMGALTGAIVGAVGGGAGYAISSKSISNAVSGLTTAESGLKGAIGNIANVGSFVGTCNYTQLGMVFREYNKAYTNYIMASATDKITYAFISGVAAGVKSAFATLLKKLFS